MIGRFPSVEFLFSSSAANRDLHSFPTRRSSDLNLSQISRNLRPRGHEPGPRAGYQGQAARRKPGLQPSRQQREAPREERDRKSTRLNSSHRTNSYAVFCLKKKIPNPSEKNL